MAGTTVFLTGTTGLRDEERPDELEEDDAAGASRHEEEEEEEGEE